MSLKTGLKTAENGHKQYVKKYFLETIRRLGISVEEAEQYGVGHDDNGDVLFTAFHYNGNPVQYIPLQYRDRVNRIKSQGTIRDVHEDSFFRTFKRTRIRPERVKSLRYLSPKRTTIPSFPMLNARLAYQERRSGGAIAVIEGEKKAISLDRLGLESVAFCGKDLFRLDDDVKEYLFVRMPSKVYVIQDSDADQIKDLSSSRAQGFYNASLRFVKEVFDFFQGLGHNCEIIYTTHSDRMGKGIDDIIEVHPNPEKIAEELLSDSLEGDIWRKVVLSAKDYETVLKSFFKLDSPLSFYNYHAHEIKCEPFVFNGLQFRFSEELILDDDPFQVEVSGATYQVDSYIGECSKELIALIKDYENIAIQSPTGSGKTTFAFDVSKTCNAKIVVAVPYRSLALQAAEKNNALAIVGSNTKGRFLEAYDADIIVATYDTIGHIPDLKDRILFIDEAHNLVNHHGRINKPFRADTIRRVLNAPSKKKVFLSGTMPKLFLHAHNIPLVSVSVRKHNKVNVHLIKSVKNSTQSLTSALVEDLTNTISLYPEKTHVVLLNNKKELDTTKRVLIAKGVLADQEIATISREHYDNDDANVLNSIIGHEKIPKNVRLVLSTCIIAEGINIRNTNIGRVYGVGIRCVDTLRQFVARFRVMPEIDFILISKPKCYWDGLPFNNAVNEYDYRLAIEESNAERCTILARHKGLPIGNTYTFPYVTTDQCSSKYIANKIAILAGIKDLQDRFATYPYIIARLLDYEGFSFLGSSNQDSSALEDVKDVHSVIRREKRRGIDAAISDCLESPNNAIMALYAYYKDKKHSRGLKMIRDKAFDVITAVDEQTCYEMLSSRPYIDSKECRGIVRRLIDIMFLKLSEKHYYLTISKKDWQRFCSAQRVFALTASIKTKNPVKDFTAGEYIDARFYIMLRRKMNERICAGHNVFLDTELISIINEIRLTEGITKALAVKMVQNLFECDKSRYNRGYKLDVKGSIFVADCAYDISLLQSFCS